MLWHAWINKGLLHVIIVLGRHNDVRTLISRSFINREMSR